MDHNQEHQPESMAPHPSERLNRRLVTSLRDISHTMRSLYEGRGSQKRVLIVLDESGTITQRELTQRLGIQPGSASEVIARLESLGLVDRSLSEADRRTANISLTEEGKKQAREALRQRQRRHEEMFSALTSEEKECLLSLLEKLNGDWEERYRDSREEGGHHPRHGGRPCHGHPRDGRFGPDSHSEGPAPAGWSCDHDCASCGHPCGRSRNR